jgi:dipeptidyl-peptidase 4
MMNSITNAPADPDLTLDRIYNSHDFDEESLGTFLWRKRGTGYFRLVAPEREGAGKDLVWYDSESERREVIVPAHAFIPPGETQPLTLDRIAFSEDESKLLIFTNTKRVWRHPTRGDYWTLDIATRELRKLGGDAAPSTLQFAKFSPNGTRVAFVRENNLYVQDLRDLQITVLTADGSDTIINGTSDWAYEEELDLRDAYRWSPDSRFLAYWQLDTSGVRTFYLLNNTEGIYSRPIPIVYPKVGEQNAAARIGVVPVAGGATLWLDIPGDPRNHYLAQMEWTPDAAQLLIQQFNRLQNTNRVMLADPTSGETRVIHTEADEAWLENENPVRWARKGQQFVWLSERESWRHAYLVGCADPHCSPITSGDFDIIGIEAVDDQNEWLYYGASPDQPTQRYLYRSPFDGGPPERLTPDGQPGWHTYSVSPDARLALHTYSTFDTPPIVELIRLPGHEVVRTLIHNQPLRVACAALRQPSTQFLRVEIGDGTLLDAWCLTPPDLDLSGPTDSTRRYPVLFYVYGEPHGQTVRDAWNGKTGLWHRMLAQQGYIVASVDNRGTPAPRGRAWRKIVHRQIGILSAEDQAAAAQALLQRWPYADTGRVGIWGYSGGGSSSLHAIFRFPNVYQTAMAVASVPNQRLYNSIYQERYMGSPADNADGYRRGSPLTYAAGLQGNLLIVHGTGDDNCHYQGVEMLLNELIAHNKPFTVMPYPNRTHALSEGVNTTRHFYVLLTRYLREHLPT